MTVDRQMTISLRFFIGLLMLLSSATTASAYGLGTKTIAVKIFVDDEEPRRKDYWQEVLGRRLDRASTILSGYGSIRFSVIRFGTWDSDDGFL